MKKSYLLIIVISISLILLIIFVLTPQGWKASLISPMGYENQQPDTISTTTISTPNAPKTFKFDSSTDLKAELESVNPQILDSDFE